MADDFSLTNEERDLFIILREIGEKNGITVRCAGGWVRDKLMGILSDDIDITVDHGSGAEFCRLFAERVGIKTSVIRANPEKSKHLETATCVYDGLSLDFVALRNESYGDTRIPQTRPGTPAEDAERRDITINALFYNIHTGQVEDFTERGLDDLLHRVIDTPCDPNKTFADDPLRQLRVIRFYARYSFLLSRRVRSALGKYDLKAKVTPERIRSELRKMFEHPSGSLALEMINVTRLRDNILDCDAYPRLVTPRNASPLLRWALFYGPRENTDGFLPDSTAFQKSILQVMTVPTEPIPFLLAAREHWNDALIFHGLVRLRDETGRFISDFTQRCQPYIGCWNTKPTLDGREIGRISGLTGPALGLVVNRFRLWDIENSPSKEAAEAWVKKLS